MKWMVTEDKLGADQKDAIEEIGKSEQRPVWIKGHAGSGKSVLLLHALSDYLAKHPKSNICVVVFTNALVDLLQTGLEQIPSLQNKSIPVYTIFEFKRHIGTGAKYDAVFCDEVQDLPKTFLETIKNSATKIIVAGDASQSIYNSVPNFNEGPANPSEIKGILNPSEKELSVIYRLTKSMLDVLKRVFTEMLTSKIPLSKSDTSIDVWEFSDDDSDDEIPFIWEKAEETNRLRPSEVAAILINSHDGIIAFCNAVLEQNGKDAWQRVSDQYGKPNYYLLNKHLTHSEIPLMYVGNQYGSLKAADAENKIVIMTYHSAKGLDFDSVFLPLVNSEMWFHSKAKELLLVALSRSKNDLIISYAGTLHPTLALFVGHITKKTVNKGVTDELDF